MRLHVVDGTYELFRAHYSKRPRHTAPSGQPVKGTAGLMSSLLGLVEDPDEAVTHIAVAFDNPIVCFRNRLFDGYKWDEGVEPELRKQFDLVERATAALGIVVWSMDEWEADDALATAAHLYKDDFEQIRIMTPDKDLGQVLEGERVVQIDRMRRKLITDVSFFERRGINPASVPDYLALVGDTADGIPGLPGFGEKTTAKLLDHYKHLDAIPDDHEQWEVKVRGASRLASTLAERRQDALLYKKLATLITDVPLEESAADLEYKGVPKEAFLAFCDELGLDRFRSRPQRWQ